MEGIVLGVGGEGVELVGAKLAGEILVGDVG